MATLSKQYEEYIELIKEDEESFIKDVSASNGNHYDIFIKTCIVMYILIYINGRLNYKYIAIMAP